MTYFQFLGLFLIPPIVIFGAWSIMRHRLDRTAVFTMLAGVLLAVGFSTPWDNLILLNSVWSYPDGRVVGIRFGLVPLEEYVFFVLQTLATSLFCFGVLGLGRHRPTSSKGTARAVSRPPTHPECAGTPPPGE